MRIRNLSLVAIALCAIAAGCDYRERKITQAERDDATYRNAMNAYQAGRLDEAVKGFEKVIASTPMNASARFQLACLQHDFQKNYLAAIANYRIYREIAPQSDKSGVALDRSHLCEEAYRQQVAEEARKNANADLLKELESLKSQVAALEKERTELKEDLAKSEKHNSDIMRENARVRRLVLSTGEGETTNRVLATHSEEIKSILEEDEDEGDRIRLDRDLQLAIAEDKLDNETNAMPFGVTEKPAQAPKEEAKPVHPPTYVVKEGETLMELAQRFYGARGAWKKILDANKSVITPTGRVKAGTEIKLP